MWVTTSGGKLVNLDNVEYIGIEGRKVYARLDVQRSEVLIEAENAAEYIRTLGIALTNGTNHVDIRHV